MKIISGGLYLVDLSGYVSPEFGLLHYCVILKTHDKDILFALPTTSKLKNEKFISKILEDGSHCLLKHARPISIKRVVELLLDNNGNQIIISNEHLKSLINDYQNYMHIIYNKAIWSNKDSLNDIKNKKGIAN